MLEHGLDRAAVLALQPIEHIESLLELLQATRLCLDPVGVGAQLGRQLAQLDGQRLGAEREIVERRVDSGLGAERAVGHRHRLRRAALARRPPRPRSRPTRRRAATRRGAAARARARARTPRRGRARGLDLGKLEAQQVEIALSRTLAVAQGRELVLDRGDLAVGRAVGAAALDLGCSGEPVERLELRGCEGQLAVLVLAVEGEQPASRAPAARARSRRGRRGRRSSGRTPTRGVPARSRSRPRAAARRSPRARARRACPRAARTPPRRRPRSPLGGRSAASPSRP